MAILFISIYPNIFAFMIYLLQHTLNKLTVQQILKAGKKYIHWSRFFAAIASYKKWVKAR